VTNTQCGDDEKEADRAPPRWMVEFFATLMVTGSVRDAVEASGAELDAVLLLRRLEPQFAFYWDKALRVHKAMRIVEPLRQCRWSPEQVLALDRMEEFW
jgi:hypothetical protein